MKGGFLPTVELHGEGCWKAACAGGLFSSSFIPLSDGLGCGRIPGRLGDRLGTGRPMEGTGPYTGLYSTLYCTVHCTVQYTVMYSTL